MNHEKPDAPVDAELRARLAALPREIRPERDLWPEIAARIETRASLLPVARRSPRLVAIAAATGGIAISALLGVHLLSPDPSAPATVPGFAANGSSGVQVVVDPSIRLATQAVDDASLDHPRGGNEAETIASIHGNLAVLDEMAEEVSAALENDPDNRDLQDQLLDIYRMQSRLLDYLVRMNTRPDTRTDI